MTFTVNLNTGDYRAFRCYCYTRYHRMQWVILVIIAAVEILTWHGHKPDTPFSEKIGSALVVLIVFAAVFGVLMLFKWILAKITRSAFQQPMGLHEYEITDSVLRERNEFGSIETKLERIKTVA
jgi:hypothetical protein